MFEKEIGTWNPRKGSIVRVRKNEYTEKEETLRESIEKYGNNTLWYVLTKSGAYVKLGKEPSTPLQKAEWVVFRDHHKKNNGNYIPISCLESIGVREAKKLGIIHGNKLPEVMPKIAVKPVNIVGDEFNKMRDMLRKI